MKNGLSDRDPIALLLYEAKRKPKIAELVNKIDTLTEGDIDAADVPLPWFKLALKKLRLKNQTISMMERNDLEPFFTHGVVGDVEGQLREWRREPTWMPVSRGNQFLFTDNFLLWFPDTGGCWVGTIFVQHYDPSYLIGSVVVKRTTKVGYAAERENRLSGVSVPKAPEEQSLFRITRL